MNQKEISEIKRTFHIERCNIVRLCGCYVNSDKEKILMTKESFLSYPEEEEHKYLEIFRKALSGKIGKNLFNMEFPTEAEYKNSNHAGLLHLKNSELKDEKLLEAFYDKVIESYDYPDAYFIVLAYGVYDIPGKTSDNQGMDDASEDVYSHLLCCICPMKLTKAGLFYLAEENSIKDKLGERMVNPPDVAFLFPAFNDRSTDIHSVLYYNKNANKLNTFFVENMLGCEIPMAANIQKENFVRVVEETFSDKCSFESAKQIHDVICEKLEENEDSPDVLELDKQDFEKIMDSCGANEEQLENFSRAYDKYVGKKSVLQAENIESPKKIDITMGDIKITTSANYLDQIEKTEIDGRSVLIIPVNGEISIGDIVTKK